ARSFATGRLSKAWCRLPPAFTRASLTSGFCYGECWSLLLTYRDHVQGRAIVLCRRLGVSLDVVACGFPRALLLLQKRHCLDRSLLICKAGVELYDHIVPIRGTWH